MDQLVPGLSGEKAESQQQSGEPVKISVSNAHQQSAPMSETQSSATSSLQGLDSFYSYRSFY